MSSTSFRNRPTPIGPPSSSTNAGPVPIAPSSTTPPQNNGIPVGNPFSVTSSGTSSPIHCLLIRRLSPGVSTELLDAMILFIQDLKGTDIITESVPEDNGFATAVIWVGSPESASEARSSLHGKPNAAKDSTLIVDILTESEAARRGLYMPKGAANVTPSSSLSSSRGSGRVAAPFAPFDPVPGSYFGNGHSANLSTAMNLSNSEPATTYSPFQTFQARPTGAPRFDDLPPSMSYPNGSSIPTVSHSNPAQGRMPMYQDVGLGEQSRRSTEPHLATMLSGLSLNTSDLPANHMVDPSTSGHSSGNVSANGQMHRSSRTTPASAMSPDVIASLTGTAMNGHPMNGHSGNAPFFTGRQQSSFPGVRMPQANPSDQNPPCNTLYVGNLPVNASEEELKSLFSRQRGFRRLCYRTKPNGPMCFVEFDNITFATKTLLELYGRPLSTSVKGGIRLSFSKNPLGVRNAPNPNNQTTFRSQPQNMASLSSFGPPPGLPAPPGLSNDHIHAANIGMGPRPQQHAMVQAFGHHAAFPPTYPVNGDFNAGGVGYPVYDVPPGNLHAASNGTASSMMGR